MVIRDDRPEQTRLRGPGRFSLLLAMAGGASVIAPLIFALLASAFTMFGSGAALDIVGRVLGYDLAAAGRLGARRPRDADSFIR